MTKPRMRTISQTIGYIKKQDPESCLSEWYLRNLIKSGQIKVHKAGNKYLVNLDNLLNFLSEPPVAEEGNADYGKLRKIK